MSINFRKMLNYIVLLIMGMSLIIFGIFNIANDINSQELSEKEIIEKAKDLGMVEIKDLIKKTEETTN